MTELPSFYQLQSRYDYYHVDDLDQVASCHEAVMQVYHEADADDDDHHDVDADVDGRHLKLHLKSPSSCNIYTRFQYGNVAQNLTDHRNQFGVLH